MRKREYSTRELDRILDERKYRSIYGSRRRSVIADEYDGYSEEAKRNLTLMKKTRVFKQLNMIANKYGYAVITACSYGYRIDIELRPLDRQSRYNPKIDYNPTIGYKKSNVGFCIQTPAYDTLPLDEFEKYLDCVNNAYEMCRELEKVDLSDIYVWER